MPKILLIFSALFFLISCQTNELLTFDEIKQKNNKEINEYIEKNKLTVTRTTSDLRYVITEKGNGAKPQFGSKVKVNYTGMLLNGQVFDKSNTPFEFNLGKGQVIAGWDEGIALLNVGDKAKLIIPSYLAYGTRGANTIPANAPLVFNVELVDFE